MTQSTGAGLRRTAVSVCPQRGNKCGSGHTFGCFVACAAVSLLAYIIKGLAELHGDLFSRHASPLTEVYVFVAVDERREHVMSDEICRRCNGKQQGRRRGGRSVQLLESSMIVHSSSRHSCTYTYVLYVRPMYSADKKATKPPPR